MFYGNFTTLLNIILSVIDFPHNNVLRKRSWSSSFKSSTAFTFHTTMFYGNKHAVRRWRPRAIKAFHTTMFYGNLCRFPRFLSFCFFLSLFKLYLQKPVAMQLVYKPDTEIEEDAEAIKAMMRSCLSLISKDNSSNWCLSI